MHTCTSRIMFVVNPHMCVVNCRKFGYVWCQLTKEIQRYIRIMFRRMIYSEWTKSIQSEPNLFILLHYFRRVNSTETVFFSKIQTDNSWQWWGCFLISHCNNYVPAAFACCLVLCCHSFCFGQTFTRWTNGPSKLSCLWRCANNELLGSWWCHSMVSFCCHVNATFVSS